MMHGTKFWNDPNRLYVQDNNAIENLVPGLEYCGPTAMVNCIMGMTEQLDELPMKNEYGGRWEPQVEDVVTLFFISPFNQPRFQQIRKVDLKQYPPNRIPQYYPWAAEMLFGLRAEYHEDGTFEKVSGLIVSGNAVQFCIKRPGHYIAALAYDDETQEIHFKDSWIGNRWPTGNEVPDVHGNKTMTRAEFEDPITGIQPWYVVYFKS